MALKIPAYTSKKSGWTVNYTYLKELAIQINTIDMEEAESLILELERHGYVELDYLDNGRYGNERD